MRHPAIGILLLVLAGGCGPAGGPLAAPAEPGSPDETLAAPPSEPGPRLGPILQGRAARVARPGPGRTFSAPAESAREFLARHQRADGGWSDDTPGAAAEANPPPADPGLTGIVLLAFLHGGYTNRGRHPFAKVVSRGLAHLKGRQAPDGTLGPGAQHGAATAALLTAYAMTGSPLFKGASQRALDRQGQRLLAGELDSDPEAAAFALLCLRLVQEIRASAGDEGRAAPFAADEAAFETLARRGVRAGPSADLRDIVGAYATLCLGPLDEARESLDEWARADAFPPFRGPQDALAAALGRIALQHASFRDQRRWLDVGRATFETLQQRSDPEASNDAALRSPTPIRTTALGVIATDRAWGCLGYSVTPLRR